MTILGSLALLLILYIGINVRLATRRAAAFPMYWQDRAIQPVPVDAIRLVALGDSIMQAIGAAHPQEGVAGRIAEYLQSKMDRPVHIANVSGGGATIRDITERQLPLVDLEQADLIILATATDLERRVPLDRYEADLRRLMGALPPGKTIFSDLPLEPGREAYQAIFQRLADEHGIPRADFAGVFRGEGRRLDIFSWLFPHLNSKGYDYWFKAFQPQIDRWIDLRRQGKD